VRDKSDARRYGVASLARRRLADVEDPAPACDLSITCLTCGAEMRPEHAHYRCPECGWRDSCCDGPY